MNISTLSVIEDPRSTKNRVYSTESLLLIIFSSVVSGYQSVEDMLAFADARLEWLKKFVELDRVPSYETLRFFLCCLKPDELVRVFNEFVESQNIDFSGDVVAIDGKTMRGTGNSKSSALHVLSAWSSEHGLTLGVMESAGKKNEIKTIPKLIESLNVRNAILTTDAMGCQKKIVSAIHTSKNDYVLQLKGNQPQLLKDIEMLFEYGNSSKEYALKKDEFEQVEKGHGRIEQRKYIQFELDKSLILNMDEWQSLKTAIRVERVREIGKKQSREVSWYISSLPLDAKLASKAVRSHWHVENRLHWKLDVIFREDEYQLYSGFGPLNMAILKRHAKNLLGKLPGKTLKRRMISCALNDELREQALFG